MSALRIQKYIMREVTVPFVLSIILFTFVLLLSRMLKLIELIIDKGVPISEILGLFGALMPSFLVITVPLSFLLAAIIAFSRLSADSEIVAMKAAGFSVYRIAMPVFILAAGICLFTAWLTMYAEPYGRSSLKQQLIDIAYSKANIAIQPQVFNDEIDGIMLYADSIDPNTGILNGVFISDKRMGQIPSVINAQHGKIYTDSNSAKMLMHLQQGAIHRWRPKNSDDSYQVIHFNSYDINLSLNGTKQQNNGKSLRSSEISTSQLLQHIKTTSKDDNLKYVVELNERCILPLSPMIFAIIAIPLGISSHRGNRGGGFAIALIVFLFYYMVFSVSKTMVLNNNWPTMLTMWTPTVLFFIGSIGLLRYTAKEQPLPGSQRLVDIIQQISQRFRRKDTQ